jgi:hypothetical protein
MKAWLLAALAAAHACGVDAAAGATVTASGRNWRLSIDSMECQAAASVVSIGARIDYLGPKGPVEAPVSQLLDGKGKAHPPRSLVWRRGSQALAQWLSAGGLSNLQSEAVAEVELKFHVGEASGDLQLEFGDIRAFPLTRERSGGCEGLLKLRQLQPPRRSRAARAPGPKPARVYRNSYPCTHAGSLRTIEAQYPPYLPRQLLVFGRGYLPNARQIQLPMGVAPAQPYLYSGPDELTAVEEAARRVLAADFSQVGAAKHFLFNWGSQTSQSGNELHSVGLYEVLACTPPGTVVSLRTF